ncbi:MAG: choice-of-anchor tandem repeat GloVer-containing protein [Candidatus Korobacteraceae bacterium]|jgi:uncharacterized repeat protein (TIGR03803 family)
MRKASLSEVVCMVFVLSAAAAIVSPAQTLTTLASFNGANGAELYASLVQGSDGNFYGTTYSGGANDYGTVFKITPTGTLTTLYSFCSQTNCVDGKYPYAGLVQGSDGNFYGTTSLGGGAHRWGTVFKITSSGTLTTLHSFDGTDGNGPEAALVQASDGNSATTREAVGRKPRRQDSAFYQHLLPDGAITCRFPVLLICTGEASRTVKCPAVKTRYGLLATVINSYTPFLSTGCNVLASRTSDIDDRCSARSTRQCHISRTTPNLALRSTFGQWRSFWR